MPAIRRILLCLQSGTDFAPVAQCGRTLAEALNASLSVLYVVTEQLAADWTAETNPAILPRLHEGMEAEARARLAEWISESDQERLGITLTIETGLPVDEILRYFEEHSPLPDLVIIGAGDPADEDDDATDLASEIVERAPCSVLVARPTASA